MVEKLNNIGNTQLNNRNGMFADFSRPQVLPKISKTESDSVEINDKKTGVNPDKKKKLYTYSAIVGGVVLAILAFLKRKPISRFIKKVFGIDAPQPPRGSSTPPDNIPPSIAPPGSPGGGGGGAGSASSSIHTPKPPHGPGSSPQSIDDLRELERTWMHLPDGHPHKAQIGRKINELERQLKENNVSFVPKAPASFASESEKIKYIQMALLEADVNEASAMDALAVFEKYGSRYTYGPNAKNINTGISDLALAIEKISDKLEPEVADRAISKYLDLFNKYARSDGEYTDTRHLRLLIERHQSKMSEETVLKMIDTLKKFSFEKAQSWSVRRYILEDAYTKRTPEELSRIEARLRELEEIVKDMPMKDKSKK